MTPEDWVLRNYIDGCQLTRFGQERYAESYGSEMKKCLHCYHVEDGLECCICYGTGLTDDKDWCA